MRLLAQAANEHSCWLDRLSTQYNRPRVELVQLLSAPGALEYEIARLISTAARAHAQHLITTRERPEEDSPDLFDRAVCGHWRTLREAEMLAAMPQLAEIKNHLNN